MTWLRPDITAAKTWYNHLFKTIKKMASFKNSLTIFKKKIIFFKFSYYQRQQYLKSGCKETQRDAMKKPKLRLKADP